MKKISLFVLTLLISIINNAQITFQKTFGGTGDDRSNSVQQTSDGGYIIAGWTASLGAGYYDFYLIKTNAEGDSLWTKTFGGTGDERSYFVNQTTDSGYIIIGWTNTMGIKVDLIKTDSNGNLLWTKTFDVAIGTSVQQTTDGGYILTGYITGSGTGSLDVYLIKADVNGDTLWIKTFGGIYDDFGYSIKQTSDGGYIIAGLARSFGAGFVDIYLIKTDSNGNSLWTKAFGGTSSEQSFSVQQTFDDGYIITGWTNSFGAGLEDVYLIKTDSSGNLLWSKTFGGTGNDYGWSVQQTTDGGYIIAGYSNSFSSNDDVYLIKTDFNGDTLWTKTFGGINVEQGYSVQQTSDGGFIVGGHTWSFGAGLYDVYLIKTDSLGNSDCNQGSTVTIVTSPPTQTATPATIVSSAAPVFTSPATIVGSGGIVTSLCTSVGINKITTNNLFILSPNPTEDNFIISFEETIMKGNLKIFNILGEKVFEENIFNESNKEIHLKNMSSGIYLVKVFDGEKSYCKKLIVE